MTQIDDDFSLDIEHINSYLANLRNHSPYEDEINDLIDHILQRGGKRIRPLLCLLSFEMTSAEERNDMSYAAACALEVIHNASLLVDDIFDKDVFRRSEQAFYLKFSTFAALSLSYSMSSLALSLASQTNDMEVVEELINALHTLSASLFLEQKFRSLGEKMTKEDALKLIDKK
ncbi:MAG: polyprenyl synthetase family protein, partial [Candidatus Heimdallarchaeaceae archaeon]